MKIKLKNLKDFSKAKETKTFFFFEDSFKNAQKFVKKNILFLAKANNLELVILNNSQKVIVFNLGKESDFNLRKVRLAVRRAVRFLKEKEIRESAWFIEDIIKEEGFLKEIFENIILAEYEFDTYKTEKKKPLNKIAIYFFQNQKYKLILDKSLKIASAVNFTRDLINIPGSEMTPKKLAGIVKKEFKKENSVSLKIFLKKELIKNGFGGIIGVSKGSKEDPQLIIVRYFGNKKSKKIDLALVGKGVTFDSGGLSIKTAEHMVDMYMDMAGAGAVIGALKALVELKIPLNIVAVIPAVENMPSSESYRPGDLLKTFSKKTIEVLNTDAEGRIILADALSYTEKVFKPKLIIDVATLTGAAIVALGQRAIALFSNKENLEKNLRLIGENSGDYVWPMPLWEEYEEEIEATFGDVQNIGSTKYGGAIIGAIFLKQFVGKTDWVHLDIAPTMTTIKSDYLAKGASGTGVRFLVNLAENFSSLWK